MDTPKNCFKYKGEVLRKWYKKYDKEYGPFYIYFLHIGNPNDHNIIVTTNNSRYGLGPLIDKTSEGDEVTVEFHAATREYNETLYMDLKLAGLINHSTKVKELKEFQENQKKEEMPVEQQIEQRFNFMDDELDGGEPVSEEGEEFYNEIKAEAARNKKAVEEVEEDDGLPF